MATGYEYDEPEPTPTEAVDPVEEADKIEANREAALQALEDLREMGVEIAPDETDAQETGGFSLDETREMLEKLDTVIKNLDMGDPVIRGQWSRSQGNYCIVGETVNTLPPGYYDLGADAAGTIWFSPIRARTDELLRFPDAATDKIIAEIETFWEREETFARFGLPYKRGILMYGRPKRAKVSSRSQNVSISTLQILARDVVKRGGIVLIFVPELFMNAYRQLRRVQPETPVVVLMEDIDATLKQHSESNVLNILDGADTIHKTVFVATTNYPENLGERIINRPSRFDRRLFVDDPSTIARRMYVENLVKGQKHEIDIERIVRDTEGMSLAHVKELFVASEVIGAPYEECLKNLKEMHLETPTSLNDRDKFGSMENRKGQYI